MQTENNTSTKRPFFSFSKKSVVFPLILLTIALVAAFSLVTYANNRIIDINSTNTFIVYDEENETVYTGKQTKTANFINEVGITLDESEYFDMPEEVTDKTAKIYIRKKNAITVKVDGDEKKLYAMSGTTISDLLNEYEITLAADDTVSVPLTDEAVDGLNIEIVRVTFKTEETLADIPFTTEKRKNANLDKGKSRVVQKGVNGSKKLVYRIRLENGVEVSRELVSEEVVKQPVKKIIENGTRVPDTSGVVKTWAGETLQYKKVLNMTATAYTTERTSDKITATGQVAKVGLVAVDPKVIPLGSKLYILSADGKSWCYGKAVAADTGVRGNKIDLFFNTHKECINFGRKKAVVYVLK